MLTGDGLHAIAEDEDGDHRLWLRDGAEPVNAGIFIPFGQQFWWHHRNAGRLGRRMEGKRSGPLPRQQRLTAFQLHRAALMLRAWDGVEAGEPRRVVASILLNSKVETLRALDWKNAPERRRLARIYKAAHEAINGGYLNWLTPGRHI